MYGKTEQRNARRLRGGAIALLLVASQLQAQTLDEVADAQRTKALAEIAAAQAAANPVPVRADKPAPTAKTQAPRIVVHSLYARGAREWIAELTDGNTLAIAAPGMRFGRYVVSRIDGSGLHLQAQGRCKKGCVRSRVVKLGEAL